MMSKSIYQWGGLSFMFGNLLFLGNKLNEMSRLFLTRPIPDVISGQDTLLIVVGQLALIFGYLSFYKFYDQRVRRAGNIALRLFSGGGILVALGHVSFMSTLDAEGMFLAVLVGLLLLLAGLVWFGIVNLRRPVLDKWQWLPLVTGLTGIIGFVGFSGEEITATFLVFRTLFAIGLIWLGLSLWVAKPVQLDVG